MLIAAEALLGRDHPLVLDFAPDAQGGRIWGAINLKAPSR